MLEWLVANSLEVHVRSCVPVPFSFITHRWVESNTGKRNCVGKKEKEESMLFSTDFTLLTPHCDEHPGPAFLADQHAFHPVRSTPKHSQPGASTSALTPKQKYPTLLGALASQPSLSRWSSVSLISCLLSFFDDEAACSKVISDLLELRLCFEVLGV